MRLRLLLPVLVGLAVLCASGAARATPASGSMAMSMDSGDDGLLDLDEDPPGDPDGITVGEILLWFLALLLAVVIIGSVVLARRRRWRLRASMEGQLDSRECLSCGSHKVVSTGPECYQCQECSFEFGEGLDKRLAEERRERIRALSVEERLAHAAEDLERASTRIHQVLEILEDLGPKAELDPTGSMVRKDVGENVLRVGGAVAAGRSMLYYSGPGVTPFKPPPAQGKRKASSKEQLLMDLLYCLGDGLDGARDATEIVQTIPADQAPATLDPARWSVEAPVRAVEEAIQSAQRAGELFVPLEKLREALLEHQPRLPPPREPRSSA